MTDISKLLKTIHRKNPNIETKKSIKLIPYQPITITNQERFTQYVKSTETENTCWEWKGPKDRYGYGKFKVNGKTVKAHRYSYELHNGTFDKSLHVLHHCDNPCCVNPNHLFLGTNRDNVADRETKNRHGETHRRLTFTQKEQIKLALREGKLPQQLAEKFNVHISTIRRIKRTDSPFKPFSE